MDNVTHTLIGVLVGESAARVARPQEHGLPAPLRRNLLVTLGAVGSNLPDADLLYSFFGDKVNYLLHHRGHTHTVLVALLLGFVVLGATYGWLRGRRLQLARSDHAWLWATVLLTPLLHIAMDFTNNYGVHPFWPLDNHWLYGDTVFIIEPLLWAACAPLMFLLRTPAARFTIGLLLVVIVALTMFTALVPRPAAIAYLVIVTTMLVLGWRASARAALIASYTLWITVTATFAVASAAAGQRIDALAAQQFPRAKSIDRVLTPMPSNPLCWELMLVQQQGADVLARRAMLSLAPSVLSADRCLSRSFDISVTAPLQPVARTDSDELKWYGEIATPLSSLAHAANTNCNAAAALRFIRVPWLASIDGTPVLGDLRYDRELALGFSEIELTDNAPCPTLVPPWIPPRKDLLDAAQHTIGSGS